VKPPAGRVYRNLVKLLPMLVVLLAARAGATVRVQLAGGYEEINSFTDGGTEYISLSELADILGGSLGWETIGHEVRFKDISYRFDFLIESPFFKLSDSVYNMTYPARFKEGQLYVPAETFLPFLDRVNDRKITWDARSRFVRVDAEYFNVTDISFSPKANGLLIEIHLTTALPYEVFMTEGNWVNVSIRDGLLNRSRLLSRIDKRYMYRLEAHQVESTGQVSIRLKRNVEKWHDKLVQDPPRIQISIADVDFQLDTADTNPVLGPDDKIDVIVIDPGHGGRDYGAIGPRGTREKDVALRIARELAGLIRKDKEFKVIMTRDRDRTVSLQDRADVANRAGTDLFISIHANASPNQQVRGWNVFFLAPARNDSARAVEQLENSYFLRELSAFEAHTEGQSASDGFDPVISILNEMIMTEFQVESHDFAMMVNREFRRFSSTPARGIDQAGFFVLNKVFAPSVLVESAFISNKTDEQLLRDKKYQRNIATGLYDAIKRFKAKYESL